MHITMGSLVCVAGRIVLCASSRKMICLKMEGKDKMTLRECFTCKYLNRTCITGFLWVECELSDKGMTEEEAAAEGYPCWEANE